MRLSEYILVAYFAWATVLSLLLPISAGIRNRALFTNAAVALVYAILLRLRNSSAVEYVRDWLPLALIILAYKEMGWFAPAVHSYRLEQGWIAWDRLILREWHGREIIEFFSPVLPTILELVYALVYAVPPITMGVLYVCGLRNRADALLTIYFLGLFLSYAQFPFWPSEPPRVVFPGEDAPVFNGLLRQFNLWLVGTQGIHTSVFPSAHVSGAFAAALAVRFVMPKHRGLVIAYFTYAILVAVATVYGRYHYAVDAIAGLAVALIADRLGIWLVRRSATTKDVWVRSPESAHVPEGEF